MSRSLNLDIHKLNFSQNGAEGFIWPFPYGKREEFCNQIFSDTVNFTNTVAYKKALPYKIALKFFLIEAIGVFWADALKTSFEKEGVDPVPPEYLRYWPYTFKNQPLPELTFINMIKRNSFDKKNESHFIKKVILKILKGLKMVRLGKGGLNLDGLKLKPFSVSVIKKDIIATQRTHTLISQAKQSDKDVVYMKSDRWFSPISDEHLEEHIEKLDAKIIDKMISIISEAYDRAGFQMPERSRIHLEKILQHLVAAIDIHYHRLLSKPETLPNELWTGTAGQVWDFMLRIAVRANGGVAIGHDHGAGLGHVNNPMMGFSELWECDAFITFNDNQAKELIKNMESWSLLGATIPLVKGQNRTQGRSALRTYSKHNFSKTKPINVMLMTEIYDGDRGRPGPSCPDIVQADWQARVVPKLKGWGYDVFMKLHPESPIHPPRIFEEEMDIKVVSQRMEEVLEDADLIIFDCIYSTSLRVAIETNIPFVIIDFYNHPWTEKGRGLIENRCSLIEGYFDQIGRRCVDWNVLKKGLEEALTKNNNHDFFDYYYS